LLIRRTYTLGATAEYQLPREVVLKASAKHQQAATDLPGTSYGADTMLQR
jgi:hypothetical protein